jgi:hypothetical protein
MVDPIKTNFILRFPRLVPILFGIIVSFLILGIVEIGFRIFEKLENKDSNVIAYSIPDFIKRDPILGAVPKADVKVEAINKSNSGKKIYDVFYTIDKDHRRKTFADSDNIRNILLCFGDSFMFGEGLQDNETLPYFLGQFAAKHGAYNLSFIGYGPQQMLAQFDRNLIPENLANSHCISLYGFLGEPRIGHVDRAIGSFHTYDWTRHFPCYELDSSGNLCNNGDFKNMHPIRSAMFSLLQKSVALKRLRFNYPLYLRQGDFTLVGEMLKKAQQAHEKLFSNKDFYVIFYPSKYGATNERVIKELNRLEVKYLDYTDVRPFLTPEYRIVGDDHPNAIWNRELAKLIVNDLKLNRSN